MSPIAIALALEDAGVSLQNAAARNQFVEQTSLVIEGIRAGYLVDAFPFPQRKFGPWFQALTTRLPKTDKDIAVAILHEDSSDSLFIVNRILLLDNLKSKSVPIWVNTDDCSVQVSCLSSQSSGSAAQLLNHPVRHSSTSLRAFGPLKYSIARRDHFHLHLYRRSSLLARSTGRLPPRIPSGVHGPQGPSRRTPLKRDPRRVPLYAPRTRQHKVRPFSIVNRTTSIRQWLHTENLSSPSLARLLSH